MTPPTAFYEFVVRIFSNKLTLNISHFLLKDHRKGWLKVVPKPGDLRDRNREPDIVPGQPPIPGSKALTWK